MNALESNHNGDSLYLLLGDMRIFAIASLASCFPFLELKSVIP